MRNIIIGTAALGLVGCAGNRDLETGAQVAAESLMAAMTAGDSASYADAQPTRAEEPCPQISREGGLFDYRVVADYGEGCQPDFGLVGDVASGRVIVDVEDGSTLTVGYDEYRTPTLEADGLVTGSWGELDATGITYSLQTDLALADSTQGTDYDAVQELDLRIGWTSTQLDGLSDIVGMRGTALTDFTGLSFDYTDLYAPCPIPSAGTISVELDGTEWLVAFDDASPQTGEVQVAVGQFEGTVGFCGYYGF